MTNIIAATHNAVLEFYFFSNNSKLHLPPARIAIILRATGTGPVGCQGMQTSELSP
jgi:hypothetical protein